jgi:hypothetical protein
VLSTSRNVDKLSHGCPRENSIAGGSSRRSATAIPPTGDRRVSSSISKRLSPPFRDGRVAGYKGGTASGGITWSSRSDRCNGRTCLSCTRHRRSTTAIWTVLKKFRTFCPVTENRRASPFISRTSFRARAGRNPDRAAGPGRANSGGRPPTASIGPIVPQHCRTSATAMPRRQALRRARAQRSVNAN